jgi:hypothetical protein
MVGKPSAAIWLRRGEPALTAEELEYFTRLAAKRVAASDAAEGRRLRRLGRILRILSILFLAFTFCRLTFASPWARC